MSRVKRKGQQADLRRTKQRPKRPCRTAPATVTNVTVTFGRRETHHREEWRARVRWDPVTADGAGRPIAVEVYDVQLRATDASGVPVETDGGQEALRRVLVPADTSPLHAVFDALARPKTWYWQGRARAGNRIPGSGGKVCWGPWSPWTTPVQPASGALSGPPAPTGQTLTFVRDESRRGSPWVARQAWNEVPQWTPPDSDPVEGAARYAVRLQVRRASDGAIVSTRRAVVEAKDEDADVTASRIWSNISRKYEYRSDVRPIDRYNRRGAWAGWTAWQRPPALTGPVTNLQWLHPKPRLYVARWGPPADPDGVIGYRVRVYRGQAPGTLVATEDVQDTRYRYEVPKADKGARHYVEVRALYEGSLEEGDPTTSADLLEGETWPAADVDLAELGQSLASGGHVSDGSPPASSPTPSVRSAIGALVVSWAAVASADPVTYEVHVSTTSGFTPSAATKVAELQGTYTWVRNLADGTPLDPDTAYYVRIVARDADGAAAPSSQASGSPARVTSPDIAASQVLAEHIAAGQIDASKLATIELAASGLIRAGAEGGRRVDIAPDGITLFAADGQTVLARLPTDPNEQPYFSGRLVAEALTVLGATLLADTSVGRDARLVLERQVTDPKQAPTLAVTWQTRDLAKSLSAVQRRGLAYTATGGSNGATPVWWFGTCDARGTNRLVECDAAGNVLRTITLPLRWSVYGVAVIGSTLYALAYSTAPDQSGWFVRRHNAQTLALIGDWNVTSWVSYSPALGANGTELLLVDRTTSQDGPDTVYFRRIDASTGASLGLVSTTYAPGGTGSSIAPTGVWTRDEGSGARWWVSFADLASGAPFDVQSFTTAGSRQANESFPTDAPWGIAHDGTSFHTLAPGTSDAQKRLTKHSSWTWTTESPTYWVAHTWRDSASGAETAISPVAQVTMKRRAYLSVTWPQRPSGADQTRVYMERGSTQPATLRRQATTSQPSALLGSFNPSGAAHPTSSTFTGSGHGAELRTSDGSPLVRADGLSRCRYVMGSGVMNPGNAADVTIAFGQAQMEVDTDGYNDPNNALFTAPFTGQYEVKCSIQWAANATGRRRLWAELSTDGGSTWTPIRDKGAADDRLPVSGTPTVQSFSVMLSLQAGHKIRFRCNQNSGGALAVNSATMSMLFLGPA